MNILGTHDLGAFILAGLMLNIAPGPDTMYILGRSIAQGRAAGIASALGISAGSLGHTIAAAFGLSAILARSPQLFTTLKYAGAAYLAYLGIRMLLDRSKLKEVSGHELIRESSWTIFRQGMLTNLLNPKVALFFLAFLPQFVDAGSSNQAVPFLLLGSIFIFNGTLWCLFLVFCASAISRKLRENDRVSAIVNKVTGGLFVLLGIRLATGK